MKRTILILLVLAPTFLWAGEIDTTYRGLYTRGEGVDAFEPCGSEKAFWVSASSWVQRPLIEFYRKNTTKPYESIYIEFRGHLLDEQVDGFAKEYDGLIRISEVIGQSATAKDSCAEVSRNKQLDSATPPSTGSVALESRQ